MKAKRKTPLDRTKKFLADNPHCGPAVAYQAGFAAGRRAKRKPRPCFADCDKLRGTPAVLWRGWAAPNMLNDISRWAYDGTPSHLSTKARRGYSIPVALIRDDKRATR